MITTACAKVIVYLAVLGAVTLTIIVILGVCKLAELICESERGE